MGWLMLPAAARPHGIAAESAMLAFQNSESQEAAEKDSAGCTNSD